PIFTEALRDQQVKEGTKVVLSVKFSGEPAPQIKWLRNDGQIIPSSSFKIVVDHGYSALEIKEFFPEDAGLYTVVARNLGGETRTSCHLDIEGLSLSSGIPGSQVPCKPKFVDFLQNKDVQEGSRAHFKFHVSGKPVPEITWYKNGVEVRPDKNHDIIKKEALVQLIIRHATQEDTGRYVCVAKNEGGQVQSSAQLNVKAPQEPPRFLDRLQSTSVREGDTVKLSVRVTGKPEPEVTWFRQGQQIMNTKDFQISKSGDEHILLIPEVFGEDQGKITVKATNSAGQSQCTADLNVEALPNPFPPEFSVPLSDQVIQEGNPVSFMTEASGFPYPQYIWQKDGRALDSYKDCSRYNVEQNGSRLVNLWIGWMVARFWSCPFNTY
ncbi:hypothetical protein HELRODRAFT_78348, partial [Helobdella robusta]|uniref:Ig-like domain-containing protein n=1 Tax=Helobdella robusta TaxID=6412 RepID=T1G3A8_HELRO